MKKYLFAFDLDGTLLNKKSEITDEVVVNLQKLRDLGHKVCIITGRSWNMTKRIYEKTKMITPAGVFNGGVIRAENDHSFKTHINCLSDDNVRKIINHPEFLKHQGDITVETKDIAYVSTLETKGFDIQREWSYKEPLLFDKETVFQDPIAIFTRLETADYEEVEVLVEKLKKDFSDFEINFWYSGFTDAMTVEVTEGNSRKDVAIKMIAEHYGIDMKDTIAFGDGNNDLTMLETAGLGVAMLNGGDKVKAVANDVTAFDNDNNGVFEYIFREIIKEV